MTISAGALRRARPAVLGRASKRRTALGGVGKMASGWDADVAVHGLAVPNEALRRAVRRRIVCRWP